MISEDKKQQIAGILVIMTLLIMAVFAFSRVNSITGFTALENAEIIPEKDAYSVGDLITLFIFPTDADYEIEVYDPEGRLYANALNFPAEKTGVYKVRAIVSSGGQTREISTQFNVLDEEGNDVSLLNAVPAADESTPINESAQEAEQTSNAAGIVSSLGSEPEEEKPQKAEDVGDVVKDDEDNAVGKKIEDDISFETFFLFVGKEGENFRLNLYHNSTRQQPVWVEGDVNAQISNAIAQPNETIDVAVPLVEGKIPRFKLHVGHDSDVFEFGIIIINVKSYPTIGGNWTVEFNTTGLGNLTITPIEGTEFGADLQFLDLRCGDTKLSPVYDGSKVTYTDYSCDSQGYETSNVISGGTHKLLFQFGDAQAMAENFAAKYVCLDGCDYSNLTGCLNTLNNTGTADVGCVLNESNQVYEINADLSFYFPLSDVAESVIKINATNVTVNCNRSNIMGNNIGYGVFVNVNTNSTIINCNLSGFDYGIYLEKANDTVINNTYINASDLYGIYVNYSYRTNITDSRVTYSTNNDGIRIAASHISFIKVVNLSNNNYSNFFSDELSDILWIYDSYFYNSSTYYSVVIKSNKTVFENNIVRNMTSDNKVGLGIVCLTTASPSQICTNITIRNNTVENNALNFLLTNSDNALIENNYFGEHTDTSFLALALNANTAIADCLNCNATFRGNIFNSSKGNQLVFGDMAGTYTKTTFVNVTNNSFYRTPSNNLDIWFENSGHTNNSIYNNSFYSGRGVNDTFGYNNTYCVQSTGNFYLLGTNASYIPVGDCGPVNLTQPNISAIYISETNISINWTRQSSMQGNMTYYVYYSFNSGSSWNFAGNTSGLNYSLDMSSFPNTPTFGVKVVPFDSLYNGTQTNASGFRLGPNNQWVCSLDYICEYNNLTGALDMENRTANNITLKDSNAVYAIYKTAGYNISVDAGDEGAVIINGTNITLNCNNTELFGGSTGYGISFAGFNNVTMQNCKLRNYSIGVNASNSLYSVFSNMRPKQNSVYGLYTFNITNSSFTNVNSSDNTGTNMYLLNSSNNTITSCRLINSTGDKGLVLNFSSYNTLNLINSSLNKKDLLYLTNNSDFNTIQNSNFENSTSENAIAIYGSNNSVFKNTIINTKTSAKGAVVTAGKSMNGVGLYNNISNNTIKNCDMAVAVISSGNWIQGNTINGSNTTTYGAIALIGDLVENNTVRFNAINKSSGVGIYAGFYSDGYAVRNNITRNIVEKSGIARSNFDLYINTSSNSTNVWNNSFYAWGARDYGTGNSFCVGNEGNFYWENISSTSRATNDCGTINITAPDGGLSYKGIIMINWTKQTSQRNVSYYVFYSNNSGTNWIYLTSTPGTNYSWNTTWIENYSISTFMVKVVPYDNFYNGTNDNSTSTFNVTVNNNWVCSDSTYCEYLDLASAMTGQNNTGEVITLMDGSTTYTMGSSLSYNMSPPSTGILINISKPNVTLNCNNALLVGSGRGYGIFSSGSNSTSIINCNIYNYSFGATLALGSLHMLSNLVINGSSKIGMNLSNVTNSILEYSRIFDSIKSNILLDASHYNIIRYVNLTNATEYGLYLKTSDNNRIYSLNSSANNLDNAYIDPSSDNNTIVNSTFANSTRNNIYVFGLRNNITTSIFSNISLGYYDMLINSSAAYTYVWLNNFYSQGVNDSGSGSLFCVNNSGNYYNTNISSTYRVTGSCGNLSTAYADKDNDGYYTIYDCYDNNALFYPGATEYCDDFDNDCDGSIDEGVCVAETFKSAGTGGSGGGGGYAFTTYRDINIQQEPEFYVDKSEQVKFMVKGIEHRLKVNKVYEYSVSATLSSEDITFEINLNETKQFDLDKDNVVDVSIRLTSISGSKAYFYLQELQPVVEEKPAEKPEEKPPEEEKPMEVIEEKPAKISVAEKLSAGLKKVNKKPFIIGAILLVVIAIMASGFIYYRDVIERIKPMEDFIESAVEKGYPKEKIRQELMETGWDEAMVDHVLDAHFGARKDMATEKTDSKNDGLKGYIDKALSSGFTKEQVKAMLLDKGWSEKEIDELMR